MSTFGTLVTGCIRQEALGEIPTGSSVLDLKERAQVAAAKAAQHAATGHAALARSWQNAATRLRKELQARLRTTSLGKVGQLEEARWVRVRKKWHLLTGTAGAYSALCGTALPLDIYPVKGAPMLQDQCPKCRRLATTSLGELAELGIGTGGKVLIGAAAVGVAVYGFKQWKQRAAEHAEET